MSIAYKLIHKASNETVDTTDISDDKQAMLFFQQKKRLPKDIFEKLYEVQTYDGNRLTRV